jgi:hypothetical protein
MNGISTVCKTRTTGQQLKLPSGVSEVECHVAGAMIVSRCNQIFRQAKDEVQD